MRDFGQAYGPDYRLGVITDHVGQAQAAGWTVHVAASGRTYISDPKGAALPVLCGEIVRIDTEDGPTDGRCGHFVDHDDIACAGHAVGINAWRNASEIERVAIEAREDRNGY